MKYGCLFILILGMVRATAQERGAKMPYLRYSALAARGGGVKSVAAVEATGRKVGALEAKGAWLEWTVTAAAQAADIRFMLPDNETGAGKTAVLGLYVNGVKVKDVGLSSYWAYQYFQPGVSDPYPVSRKWVGEAREQKGEKTFMSLDEVHFRLERPLRAGDTIRLQKEEADGVAIGIDFIELEALPAVIGMPAGALSVVSFGAVPDDDGDDLAAFDSCIRAAAASGRTVYIPPGRYLLSDKLLLDGPGSKVQGAGIWYTQLYFSTNRQFYGGIVASASGVEIAGFSMNTANNSRLKYAEEGARMPGSKYKQYKGFSGTYGSGSRIHDIWVEHFECGFWIAGYDPRGAVAITTGLVIANCRIRNNYADGVNFSQGTSHSVVENCSIRNNGDDGMAVWPNNAAGVQQPCIADSFRYNTIEDNWRAAGAAIFGGWGHRIDHNLFLGGVGGSGIRMTNDFSGFGFDTGRAVILIDDNTIIGSGTKADIWDRPKGAIELDASKGIFGVRFEDNVIAQSQWEPVHVVGKLAQVAFTGTKIDGKVSAVKAGGD